MSSLLSKFERVDLCHQPTALEFMPRLSEHFGGLPLWIKRDDCTGLASGGNKTRKLEFLMADALSQGADMVVTQGAVQSNHVRQTAAACCKLGLECYALLERRVSGVDSSYECTGNVFLDNLFGLEYEFRSGGLDMNAEAMSVADKFRSSGRNVYFIPGGGSNEVGALGYVSCAEELLLQIRENDLSPQGIVLATGSTGTQAGLLAGFLALGCEIPLIGISVRQNEETQIANVYSLAERTAKLLTDKELSLGSVLVDAGYVGEGYGMATSGAVDACSLLARKEAILLDLVYAGKGMAGLIGWIEGNKFSGTGEVIFLHTGGSVSLFAYEEHFSRGRSAA